MATLTLSLLGSLQIVLDEQHLTKFGSINAQGLMITFALHAERPLSREVLAARFWPEEPEDRARANLRQNLHQLRKLLGDLDDSRPPFLLVTRHDVRLNPESDYAVDVKQFLAAVDVHDLEQAVSLYKGDLLPGFTTDSLEFEEWLRQERETLHHLGLEAMSELAQDLLGAGSPDEAAAIARRQINLEPWREAGHRQLMLAYALAGDRTNALAQYEACREILQEELGLDPAPETTALYEEIKAGRIAPPSSEQPILPPQKITHNLPAQTTPLLGRELEVAQIMRLLGTNGERLVIIVAPGGMGKTRLAQALGLILLEGYPDGVIFVDLAPLEGVGEIPPAIAAALNYQAPAGSGELFPQLLVMLGRKRLLLILDNFEHLENGEPFVSRILESCPQVDILVTSRRRLNLAMGSHYDLGGLEYPDVQELDDASSYTAVQLFEESGRRVRQDFALSEDNAADVIRICRQVEGMPLGLLLAASWLELLSPAEITAEIETGLDFLAADLADLPPRQRSMQAVFRGSWEILALQEREVLARLSIFRGGFTRQAAEQVASANLRVLLALANKSLIQREAGSGRFTMHELLRQYAAAKRREQGEPIDLWHCCYFANLVANEFHQALGFYPYHLGKKLAAEMANISRAWDYALIQGLADELLELTRALESFAFVLGTLHQNEEKAIRSLKSHGLADNHPVILQLSLMAPNLLEGHTHVRQAFLDLLPLIMEQEEPWLRYWALEGLAHHDSEQNNPEAVQWIDKALQSARQSGDNLLEKVAEAEALWIRTHFGLQEEAALSRLHEMLDYFEPQYPQSFVVYGLLWSLAASYRSINAYQEAITYGKRCLSLTINWQDLGWISAAEENLARIYLQMDQPAEAASHILDLLEWHLSIGQNWQTLGFFYAKSRDFPELVGGYQTAVSFMSMVYHHPETHPGFKIHIDEARPSFEEKMGAAAFAAVWDEGKALDLETAVAQFRTALSKTL